jgi:hypothetical protein
MYWYADYRTLIAVEYSNGDIEYFPVDREIELDNFLDFMESENFAALAILIGDDKVLINFNHVRSIRIIE